jgi:exopolysaccharide production protein ExoZ
MPPQPGALVKIWSIQVLRFIAALLVVHLHAVDNVWALTRQLGFAGYAGASFGHCGVDIFFVISGFIITRTSQGLTSQQFIAHRARRILPLYYAISAGWTLAFALTSHIDWRVMVATWTLWPAVDGLVTPIVPMGWTLCYEALFYAAFALVMWRAKAAWAIALLFAIALAFPVNSAFEYIGNPIIFEFLAGVALAKMPAWRPAIYAIPVGVALLVAGAVWRWPTVGMAIDSLSGHDGWARLAGLGIPAVLIVWGTIQLQAREGVFTRLGDASYALYLIHPPICASTIFLLTRFAHAPADLAIAGGMGASVLIAWRIHELFEKPILAWSKKMMAA